MKALLFFKFNYAKQKLVKLRILIFFIHPYPIAAEWQPIK